MTRVFCLLLLLATPALAAPPVNTPVEIQPDETFPWQCEFHATMASVVGSATVTKLQGSTDATPGALITNLQIDPGAPTRALWTFTPAGRPVNNVYWVHILVEDPFASRFACDGKVTIRQNKPTT